MREMLEVIRDTLKDVHIEDGTINSFDRVCLMLHDKLNNNSIFVMGERSGREEIQRGIVELLNIKECSED